MTCGELDRDLDTVSLVSHRNRMFAKCNVRNSDHKEVVASSRSRL